jgi:hypothetical protein
LLKLALTATAIKQIYTIGKTQKNRRPQIGNGGIAFQRPNSSALDA